MIFSFVWVPMIQSLGISQGWVSGGAPGSSRKPYGGSMARWIGSLKWPASALKATWVRPSMGGYPQERAGLIQETN